jgi:hypothetical protein
MALLFMDGFDLADSAIKWGNASTGNATTATTRFGYCLALYLNTNAFYKDITASTTTYVGFAVRTNGASPEVYFGGDNAATSHIRCVASPSGLSVFRGATQIAIYNTPLVNSNYYYVEFAVTISSTVGSVICRLDGVQLINFSGNTKNGGTNDSVDRITFNVPGGGGYFDDCYICNNTGGAPYNNFLGDVRVYSLSPTAAGSSTQWTPDSGSNYARVNEVPYSAANYVQSNVSGNRDTYALADLPGGAVTTIYGLQNNVIAKRTDAGAIAVKPAIKSNVTIAYGTSKFLGVGDVVISDLRTTDPDTATAWTVSGINALEAGMEVA